MRERQQADQAASAIKALSQESQEVQLEIRLEQENINRARQEAATRLIHQRESTNQVSEVVCHGMPF